MLENYVASARTPPGKPDGRVVASLLHFDQPGLRTGDLMTFAAGTGPTAMPVSSRTGNSTTPPARPARGRRSLGSERSRPTPHRRPEAATRPLAGGPQSAASRVPLVTQDQDRAVDPRSTSPKIAPNHGPQRSSAQPCRHRSRARPTLKAERPGRLEIDVDCPARAIAGRGRKLSPRLARLVDGDPQAVYRVNGDFMGCVVGPGKHRVMLSFQPASLGAAGWPRVLD